MVTTRVVKGARSVERSEKGGRKERGSVEKRVAEGRGRTSVENEKKNFIQKF